MNLETVIPREVSQIEKGKYVTLLHVESKKWCKLACLQNRNRVTNVESKLWLPRGNGEGGKELRGWNRHIHTTT